MFKTYTRKIYIIEEEQYTVNSRRVYSSMIPRFGFSHRFVKRCDIETFYKFKGFEASLSIRLRGHRCGVCRYRWIATICRARRGQYRKTSPQVPSILLSPLDRNVASHQLRIVE